MNFIAEKMSDEEKSYHEWVSNNLHFIQSNKDHIKVMKILYVAGFLAGKSYQRELTPEEQLQK